MSGNPAEREGQAGAVWIVVLAGGVGSRFWPISTPEQPKQLLPLVTSAPMLRDTLDRVSALAPAERTLVLTNAALAAAVKQVAPELPPENVIGEPRPAGTAAALAWAAHEIARRDGPEAVMVSVHADAAIGDVAAFQATLVQAAGAAATEHGLVTVGIVPRFADTGLGYIEPGATVSGSLRRVTRFIEKPDLKRAEAMVAAGCLWNSGIFAWRTGDLLDELRAHCPEVAGPLDANPASLAAFFGAVTKPIAIDVGVLERSSRVMVVRGDFDWSDVGTWAALRTVRTADAEGNVLSGTAFLRDARNNVVHAEGPTVVLYGVDGLVVVTTNGVTLVTTVERASDLKTLLDSLPGEVKNR
ncbi:MAG TPA: sugar phosphate nucleotidyltransferase [Gemmatimonadaceae bacterium]